MNAPNRPRRSSRTRLLLTTACAVVLAAAASTVVATTAHAEADRQVCSNTTGTHNGFYFSFWKDSGDACMVLRENGRYTSSWGRSTNNWVGGKGWATGGRRTITYSGTYNPGNNNTYLALYGWTRNPLIEYYVLENFGSYNPASGATRMGSVNVDGSNYGIYRSLRVNAPSIDGTQTFYQFWSVRESKRTGGTISFATHADAWARAGMNLGSSWAYQVMATEGYQSQGSSDITVREGNSQPPTSSPPVGSGRALVGAQSGRCLDVPNQSQSPGTRVQIYDCWGGANQQWTHTSGRQLQVYGSMCLDASNGGTTNGTPVIIYTCNGQANQQWNVNSNGSITSAQSGLCLDAAGSGNGAQLQLYSCWGGANQQWSWR